jgi:hypothetical protein
LLSRGHAIILVAEQGQVRLGYVLVTLRERSRQARLYSLAVDPEARGRGLARALLLAGEQAARLAGRDSMRLEVRVDNDAGIRLYRTHDYHEVTRRANYYSDGAAALCMVKSLRPHSAGPLELASSVADDVLVVVDRVSDWLPEYPRVRLTTAQEFLDENFSGPGTSLVINLCRSQRYQSRGYYCSLLAEARGLRVLPSSQTGQDLRRTLVFTPQRGFDADALALLASQERDSVVIDLMFGRCGEPALAGLARELFEAFPTPLLRVLLTREQPSNRVGAPLPNGRAGAPFPGWRVRVTIRSPHALATGARAEFAEQLRKHALGDAPPIRRARQYRHRLALLVDSTDPTPPSNDEALHEFIRAGARLGIACELLHPREAAGKLARFDALFIRTTTRVDHFSYRLARRAWSSSTIRSRSSAAATRSISTSSFAAARCPRRPRW